MKIDVDFRKSIFVRSVLTFLMILIPLYMLSALIYKWGINTVREEIINTTQSQVSSYLHDLEADILRIRVLQYDCLNDNNMYTIAVLSKTMSNYDVAQTQLSLQQRLKAIKNSSSYISNVSVFIYPIDMTISALSINHGITEAFKAVKSAPPDVDSKINYWNGNIVLVARSPYASSNPNSHATYTIVVEFDMNEIEKVLKQFDDNKSSVSFLLNPKEKLFISTDKEEAKIQKFKTEVTKSFYTQRSGYFTTSFSKKPYLVIFEKSNDLNIMLTKCIPEDAVFGKLKAYRFMFWILTISALLLAYIFSSSLYKNVHKPMIKMVKSLHKVEEGDLSIRIVHGHNDEFRYLYERFNAMAENLSTLIDQMYKQKILAQRAELKHLQSQINPHFLYNSFFTLNNMVVNGDYEFVEHFTNQLGNYFKFITRSSVDEIPLSREVEHARTYAGMNAQRFRNRISLEFDTLPIEYENIIVPRLILQPLIENAFEHGLKNKMSNGFVSVKFIRDKAKLLIQVDDNGDEAKLLYINDIKLKLQSEDELVESTGIINIHKRIVMKFGEGNGIDVSESELGGFKVKIIIPIGGELYE